MSDIVNEDQSLLAAEFVLGTLDADERARASELLGRDQPFGESVSLWERRLGELHLMVEPVEPNLDVWYRIRRRVLGVPAPVEAPAEAPRIEAPEVAPAPQAAEQLPQHLPQLEVENIKEPKQPPPVEVADAEPASEPDAVEPEPDLTGPPFVAVETAQQSAAPNGETVTPAPPALQLPPEPVVAHEPSWAPKGVAVHDLRAEREVLTARDLKGRKRVERGGGAWRALGPLMTLVAAALAGLIVAWRYVPDRLPPQLQPTALLNMPPSSANAAKKPPRRLISQFEE